MDHSIEFLNMFSFGPNSHLSVEFKKLFSFHRIQLDLANEICLMSMKFYFYDCFFRFENLMEMLAMLN